MSTITKEWLQQKIADMEAARDEIPFGLDEDDSNTLAALRIALASLEAEPVGAFRNGPCGYSPSFHEDAVPLYTAPPAPVALPSGYSDFEEIWSSSTHPLTQDDEMKDFAWDIWNACRAAMLQGADRPQNEPQNIPENIPATQFKPVADLYGLTSPTGGETSFTFDAVEARDFIDGGWLCQEYVTLERYQETLFQGAEPVSLRDGIAAIRNLGPIDAEKIQAERDALNSPVITDGWVACSERMPEKGRILALFGKRTKENCDPYVD